MCYDKIIQKEDPYIKSFEQLLATTVEESFGISKDQNMEEL